MRRNILLILLGLLLTSCGSMYQFSTINHTPEYIGDVRVDVIESRMDLNWKLRTDNQFRWDFANYAQNQPLSWYYDNSWELGLYRGNFTAFDFYWNRNQLWWDWAFGYPYNYGWNSPHRWSLFGYDRWGYNNYGWNYGFRNSWGWGYNPYRWNYGFNYDPYRHMPNRNRNVVHINGRRGSNVVVTPNGGSNRGNDVVIRNRGRNNNVNISEDVRKYRNKIVPRKDIDDIARDLNNGRKVRTYENPNTIRNNNNNNINRGNTNSRPSRNYNVPRPNNNNNIRRTPSPPPTKPVVRPNVSRGSSTSGRSSSNVIRRKNE